MNRVVKLQKKKCLFFKKVNGMRSFPTSEPVLEEEEEFEVVPNESSTLCQVKKRPIRNTKHPDYLSYYIT
jgi:hypothetical protein